MTRYRVRPATHDDLDAVVALELEVARISFADEAVTDPEVHAGRVRRGIDHPRDQTVVVVADDHPDVVLGWAWTSARTNSMTDQAYGNFRTLATVEHVDRSRLGELLLEATLRWARQQGLTELVGKVHVANTGMRVLYRKYGFEAQHLTMRRREP